jgi:hypothetical protein
VQAGPGAPVSSQLVVVNSNFDLRYDLASGGTVLVVDPDQSPDSATGGGLAVLGALRTASFGGEVGIAGGPCLAGWPDCPSACTTLSLDPVVAAGGARVVFTSRSVPAIYSSSMDSQGILQCGAGCETVLPVDRLDPYGVSVACSASAGAPAAYAFVTHLQASNVTGWLSRVNLLSPGDVQPLVLGATGTYATVFNPADDRLFVSSEIAISQQFRWFNPLVDVTVVNGYPVPDFVGATFPSLLTGAVARDMAVSSDGLTLYVTVALYDSTAAVQAGIIYVQGGAVAFFDLSPSPLGEPSMTFRGVARTCVGSGQIRRLPARAGKPDLFAITCDTEGALAILDGKTKSIVRYVGHDPTTGLPVLGRSPFGLAAEPIDPSRAITQVAGPQYTPSPCSAGHDCARIYVGSFLDNWIDILELDPDQPTEVALVKRIGSGP